MTKVLRSDLVMSIERHDTNKLNTMKTPQVTSFTMKAPTIDIPSHAYTHSKAVKIAAELQAGDEDWTYKVIPSPSNNGMSIIKIYDEEGEFVATH